MRLSGHFNLQELTKSQTATRKGIDNTPTPEHIERLTDLCLQVLEPTRRHLVNLWLLPQVIVQQIYALP